MWRTSGAPRAGSSAGSSPASSQRQQQLPASALAAQSVPCKARVVHTALLGCTPTPAAAPPPAAADAAPVEEKTSFTVVLAAAGDQKINVIKAVREVRADLGLKEAKDLVDAAPKEVLTNVKKEEADAAKEKLTAAGATVEVK